jgi:hypothetical protein
MVLFVAQCWAAKHGLALAASLDEGGIARRGGRCPAVAPLYAVEPSSWLELSERSLFMVWL